MSREAEQSFSDQLPDDIQAALREEAGQWAFGTTVHPEWPANWHEVFLSRAVEKELAETCKRMMEKAAVKLPKLRKPERWELRKAIEKAVEKHLRDLIDAARLPPRVRKWEQEIEAKKSEVSRSVAVTRAAMQKELRGFRKQRDAAREMMTGLTTEWEYPPVPEAHTTPSKYGDGLPAEPGVYFVWNCGRVAYVGQSIRLSQRATTGHERIRDGDMLSWLQFPRETLDFAEAFYIGVARPLRNFGKRAKHRELALR